MMHTYTLKCIAFKQSDKRLNWVPHFYRCRTVEIINDKYVTCSCGMPARHCSFPCRHIFALFKKCDIRMFGVRWLIQYQHCFERAGKEDLTQVFRDMQEMEFQRRGDLGEHVYIGNMLSNKIFNHDPDVIYPRPIHGTTGEYDSLLFIL